MGIFGWGKETKAAGEGVQAAAQGLSSLASGIRSAITGDLPPETVEKLQEFAVESERIKAELIGGQQNVETAAINKGGFTSAFLAGWRPAIGWICALSLFFYFVPQFIAGSILWVLQMIKAGTLTEFPLSIEGLTQLVFALLGTATLRTVEKGMGVQHNH